MAKSDYVENVAASIIEQLKQGTAPWIKPWKPGERFMPYNPTTGNEYHGMNAIWLLSVSESRGYNDARWMTFRQAQEEGAQVQKGEKGTPIQYWKWQGMEPKLDADGKPVLDEEGKPVRVMVRYQKPRVWSAVVFNASQMDGLPEAARPLLSEWERHEQAEQILTDSAAKIIYQPGDRAFYRPSTDSITLPERGQFPAADNFYAAALHELGHWTGHHTRLDRDLNHPFGSEGYAKEELRAEIASLMLGEQLGIGHDPGQHVAYIKSWIRALQEDPREIFRASSDAEKIVGFLQGLEKSQEQTAEATTTIQVPVLVHGVETNMQTSPERTYLVVPYEEKNEAKALGSRWDKEAKAWYAPPGIDLGPLEKWMPGNTEIHIDACQDPKVEFAEALREAGLMIEGQPEMDGQLRRVRVDGDRAGETSGAYVGFSDGHPAGYINNYKTGLAVNWKARVQNKTLNAKDRARLAAEAAQRRQERAKQLEAQYEHAAQEAEALFQAALPIEEHPYLSEKQVQSYGLRQDEAGNLMVPVRDLDGKTWSIQSISPEGRKSFMRNGRIQGGHYLLGDADTADSLLIAEGYATAATVHELTGLPVAVAFNSGNLVVVAEAFRSRYPEKLLCIAGDNDHRKEQEGKTNIGRQKAQEAAELVGGTSLLPAFEIDASGSDWNDLLRLQGSDMVRRELKAGISMGKHQAIKAQTTAAREMPQTAKLQEPVLTQ
jgi:putative DNA primase/helicase